MSTVELLLVAIGLSMDAFAVSVCHGLSMRRANFKKALIVGLYFGVFQAVMPLIGYYAGAQFSDAIVNYDHWIVFVLLAFIGGKMIVESLKKDDTSDGEAANTGEVSLGPVKMLPLAVATSIDALAVGVSFAFIGVQIVPAVSFIGVITLVLSMAGVKIGNIFGTKLKSKAELAGGVILVLIGVKILLEHLGVI